MTGNQQEYLFAGLLVGISVLLAAALVILPAFVSALFRLNRPSTVKLQPYECGITPTGSARVRFSIKFYMVAMVFILFDIEAVFLWPWAMVHRWLGWFGLVEMGIFILILLAGYVYVWKRGAFQWD